MISIYNIYTHIISHFKFLKIFYRPIIPIRVTTYFLLTPATGLKGSGRPEASDLIGVARLTNV